MKASISKPGTGARCVRIGVWGVVLLLLAPLWFERTRAPLLDRLVERTAVRTLVREWNLSGEGDDAMLARMVLAEMNRPVSRTAPLGEDLPPVAFDPERRFSRQWTYGDLAGEDRVIAVAIHMQERRMQEPVRQWVESVNAGDGLLQVRMVDSLDEFVAAFEAVDMIFYFGHANLGRGLLFGDADGGEDWLWLAPPELELPEVRLRPEDEILAELPDGWFRIKGGHHPALDHIQPRCKILWFMSCRSHTYYHPWFARHFPAMDLVTTHYILDTTTPSVQMLEAVRVYMEAGQPIDAVVAAFNQRPAFEWLYGRLEEQRYYRGTEPRLLPLYTSD